MQYYIGICWKMISNCVFNLPWVVSKSISAVSQPTLGFQEIHSLASFWEIGYFLSRRQGLIRFQVFPWRKSQHTPLNLALSRSNQWKRCPQHRSLDNPILLGLSFVIYYASWDRDAYCFLQWGSKWTPKSSIKTCFCRGL